jgi:hypothetical protein
MDYSKLFDSGMTYPAYLEYFSKECLQPSTPLHIKYKEYLIQNWARTQRLNKIHQKTQVLRSTFQSFLQDLNILVISEPWCGDAAQLLPIVCNALDGLDQIHLKIFLRDENPELMNQFLTNGTKSIPIFVFFDANYNVLLQWGPRPEKLQLMYEKWKNEMPNAEVIYYCLHKWYSDDKGLTFVSELSDKLNALPKYSKI